MIKFLKNVNNTFYSVKKGGIRVQQIIANTKSKDKVQIVLEQVQDNLIKICNTDSSYSNHLTQYLINRGGKRLRPLLVTLTSIHDCETSKVVDVATAAELIHTASLVHDDIVDDSPLRRGVQTLNNKWNNSVAVLVGDFLFAKSFEILSKYPQGNILFHYTKAISLNNRYNPKKSEEQYYKEIMGKTGALISTCCKVGAILSNMDDKDVENLSVYGTEIGYAFQIIDDLLDIKGETQELGKPVFNDLVEGNITLPLILLLKSSPYREDLEDMILEKEFDQEKLSYLRDQFKDSNALSKTWEIAKGHIDNALSALGEISYFSGKERLNTIANFILERNK